MCLASVLSSYQHHISVQLLPWCNACSFFLNVGIKLNRILHIVPSFSYLFPLQLVLLGDSGVGKSCIVLRFVRGQFDPTSKVKLATNVFRFHELYVHCTLTFSHVLFRFTFFHLMNLGNCWCIIFVTNIGIRGLHNTEVWNMGYCWPREVHIRGLALILSYDM